MGKLNPDRLPIKKLNLDLEIGNQVVNCVTQDVAPKMGLLVVFGVHEVVVITIVVEVLHLDLIHSDLFDRIGRTEAMFKHGAGTKIAQLGLDESAKIARRAVLNAKHRMQIIIVFDDHARAKLSSRNRHCWVELLKRIW